LGAVHRGRTESQLLILEADEIRVEDKGPELDELRPLFCVHASHSDATELSSRRNQLSYFRLKNGRDHVCRGKF
ncbi:MAG: hypothetical protein DMG79_21670, partial [Acidobacteria bacterium]